MEIHLLLGKDLPNEADAMDRLCDMSSSSKKSWRKLQTVKENTSHKRLNMDLLETKMIFQDYLLLEKLQNISLNISSE